MRIQARTDLERCCLSFETGISDPGKQHGNLGNQAKNDSGSKQRRSWEATRKPGEKILNRGKDTKLTIVYGSNVGMRAVALERTPFRCCKAAASDAVTSPSLFMLFMPMAGV